MKAVDNPSSQNPLLPTPIEANNINKEKNQLAANTGTTYDDAGNVTIDQRFRNLKYAYDANGRISRSSSLDDVNQSNSVYDATGQRVAQQINGIWKFFVYNAFGKMVAEYGGLSSTDEGGVKYIQQDIQGSTRAITSVGGAVKARMDYAAYGEEISGNVGQRTAEGYGSSDSLRQKYAQTERDEATGLDHTLWRKNENRAGRWTSPDPYNGSANTSDPQSFNRYSYVENQPTNYIDPSGLNMEEGSRTCIRYHYTNLTGTISFWGPWTCVSNGGGGGGGGGGGEVKTNKDGQQAKRVTKEQVVDCLKKTFNIMVGPYSYSWGYNKKGAWGSFSLTALDNESFNFSRISGLTNFSRDMGSLAVQYNSETSGKRYSAQSGYTSPNNKQFNWIASDVISGARNGTYTRVGVEALFFHEMGNMIASLLGQGINSGDKNDPTGDRDKGQQFENCLYGGRVGLRTGRVGNEREL